MSEENFDPEAFAEFLRQFLENQEGLSPEQLAAAAGLSQDPKALAEFVAQLRSAISAGDKDIHGGVNWKIALEQARKIAAEKAVAVSETQRQAISESIAIGTLWLDEATTLSTLTTNPKLLTRELWVADALPLFQELAAPVAERMANALTENLQQNLPEEMARMPISELKSPKKCRRGLPSR